MIRTHRFPRYRLSTLELTGPELTLEIKFLSQMSVAETRTIARGLLSALRPWLHYFKHTGFTNDSRGVARGLTKSISPANPTSHLGFEIRMKRLKLGLSQTEFAEKMGITRSHLSDLERGLYAPRARLKQDLERIFRTQKEEINTE